MLMWFAERRAMLPVLGFWFGATPVDAQHRVMQWLGRDPALRPDLEMWSAPLAELALEGQLDHLAGRPHGSLALVLLLDATPRLVWPEGPRAYAGDLAAQGHVIHALATRQDAKLDRWQRMMFYLPLMHAEDQALQERSVQEYGRLLIGAEGAEREAAEAFHAHALEHREIIWRFGRFPDRNAVLHRISSIEEKWYLHDTDRVWFAPQPRVGEVPHAGTALADTADGMRLAEGPFQSDGIEGARMEADGVDATAPDATLTR